ncbi:TonB-dependent receptor [Massilia arenosa]|uniref:TonB-dependent receptor n=2 Tax=Zemynaea arenosa TaxID=2561931 RepID=A0A4Y9S6H6_9BURK|nr:TonB-dependent receptor [Massilia arenosa]
MARAVALALAILAAGTAAAQDSAAAPAAPIQRVEITGSSIKRAEAETASPVQVITRDDLAKSGKATVAEYLQTLTSDGAGSLPTGFVNGFAAGSTAISLRGLGATSTLVLLNGRRMAPFARADDGQKTFTDLSTVPMEAVDRIEVLKDGASATYGADAIAGVVNIILRKDMNGTIVKATAGTSTGYHDNNQARAALTWGRGDLDADGYNLLLNAEVYRSNELLNKDRRDRAWIGHGDLRPWGYALETQFATGFLSSGVPGANVTGALRNPVTNAYVFLPGCAQLSESVQADPKVCVAHQDQWRSMQPQIDGYNLYAKGTWRVNGDLQAYAEASYSKRDTSSQLAPPTITPTVSFPPNAAYPQGLIPYGSGSTAILMAAQHPQNPFGAAVRVRYGAWDVGPNLREANNEFSRVIVGLKGQVAGWDIDAGLLHSQSELELAALALNMGVLKAALGDPSSSFFPYYIGAEAKKNPASLYAALAGTVRSHSTTRLDSIDAKASRELLRLPGGMLGLAVGVEHREEKVDNPSFPGSENGSINQNYVAAKGSQEITAVYAEVAAPVLPALELSAAVRYDRYNAFTSTTPKAGIKWTPLKTLALRGTYSEGFRAPGPAESGKESQSTGTATATDPVRCPNGTPLPGASAADCQASITAIKVGDPNLKPETSRGVTLGIVWDPFEGTSLALDGWRIRRENEINPLPYNEAAALPTAIRSDNNLKDAHGVVIPNTGTLLLTYAPYRNSSYTEIKGVDLDLKKRLQLGAAGRLTLNLTWTHIASWLRAESATVKYQYAGTHGNCDTSNCAGTPKDKGSLTAAWDRDGWNVSATANYRADMQNVLYAGARCASAFADKSPAPNADCRLASFTTVDLSVRYNLSRQLQLFGSVSNLFDKIAPLDPLTYGGMSYNPMDASGAIGRYLKVGARYSF